MPSALRELIGWAAIGGIVAGWDATSRRHDDPDDTRHRTLSRIVWDLLDGPISGPVVAGVVCGTGWHLLHRPRGH